MDRVPEQTIGRLPIYLRCLIQAASLNMPVINSLGLAQRAGTNAAQVRKDLSFFGGFGVRGVGYSVGDLRDRQGARRLHEVLVRGCVQNSYDPIVNLGDGGTFGHEFPQILAQRVRRFGERLPHGLRVGKCLHHSDRL